MAEKEVECHKPKKDEKSNAISVSEERVMVLIPENAGPKGTGFGSDSGASKHMVQSTEMLKNVSEISEYKVRKATDEAMTENLCEELDLVFEGNIGKTHVTLANVLKIPGIYENEESVAELMSKGTACLFRVNDVLQLDDDEELGYDRTRSDGLCTLLCRPMRATKAMISTKATGVNLEYDRLGHTASSTIKTVLAEELVLGFDLRESAMHRD